jgi:hypothetical protein
MRDNDDVRRARGLRRRRRASVVACDGVNPPDLGQRKAGRRRESQRGRLGQDEHIHHGLAASALALRQRARPDLFHAGNNRAKANDCHHV